MRCGTEPLDEGAIKVGSGRVQFKNVFERAMSAREMVFVSRIASGVPVEVGVDEKFDVDIFRLDCDNRGLYSVETTLLATVVWRLASDNTVPRIVFSFSNGRNCKNVKQKLKICAVAESRVTCHNNHNPDLVSFPDDFKR